MTVLSQQLLHKIRQVATEFPTPILYLVVKFLSIEDNWSDSLTAKLLHQLPKASLRVLLIDLIDTWQLEASHLSGNVIASSLATADYCNREAKQELSLELVWTGPNPKFTPLRRTDQVLLQLIREAKQELVIVSFAVYKIPELAKALISAIERGVKLRLVAETPEASQGKIPFGIASALSSEILGQAQVLVWPLEQRLTDQNGRYGSLHVKCALSDRKHLFISSANLTEYALSLNMEMGLLLHNEAIGMQVNEHIEQLINNEILVSL